MFLKSVFQNKVFINIVFYVLVFITGFLFLSCFNINKNNFNIPLLNGIDSDIRVNIEGNGRVFANDEELHPAFSFGDYKIFGTDNFPIFNLTFKNLEAKSLVVSIGDKIFCFDKIDSDFIFPYKNGRYITDKGVLKHFQMVVLSPFYNFWFYIFPFCFLFFTFLIYKFNKDKISFNIKADYLFLIIFILALCIRLADLSLTFWTDEFYSAYVAGNNEFPFRVTFSDPGNPPLFFIFVWIMEFFIGKNEILLRLLPVLFSLISLIILYRFLKKETDSKIALLSSFLFSINIYSIVASQELRAYSLCILLTVLITFYFFEIKKNPSNKNFILYFLSSMCAFNAHYFMSFILFSNFILGLFLFKKEKLKFFFVNAVSFLTFLPFIFITGFKKGLLDDEFNVFSLPDFNFYTDTFIKFAQGKLTAIFILVFLIVFLIKKEKDIKIYLYSIFMIFSVFILSSLFSFLKPVCQTYYFICLLPFFIILPVFLVVKNKGILKYIIAFLIFISYFGQKDYINRDKERLLNFKPIVSYYNFDKKENSALILPHSKKMISNAFKINEDEIYILKPNKDIDKLLEKIEDINADNIYVKLEHKILNEFLNKEKYPVSIIRINKDAIIARIRKEI